MNVFCFFKGLQSSSDWQRVLKYKIHHKWLWVVPESELKVQKYASFLWKSIIRSEPLRILCSVLKEKLFELDKCFFQSLPEMYQIAQGFSVIPQNRQIHLQCSLKKALSFLRKVCCNSSQVNYINAIVRDIGNEDIIIAHVQLYCTHKTCTVVQGSSTTWKMLHY